MSPEEQLEMSRVIRTETVRNGGSRPGRNDPCPCSSGKKFKKCCMQTAREQATACAQCGGPAKGVFSCTLCPSDQEKKYAFCASHEAFVRITIQGHASRVHPEKFPDFMRRIAANPIELARLRVRVAQAPHLWAAQLAQVEKHVLKN